MTSTTGRITGSVTGNTVRLPHQGISRAPCFPDVLAWHTGVVQDDIFLRDLAGAFGPYPLQMVNGPFLSPDGVDTFTTATDHGTIVSYEGTSDLVYDGSTVTATAGTFYNLLFSDGTLYPCIGKTNTLNPTSTWATNGSELVIVSLDYVAMWAGVQQTLFHEVRFGYWEDVNGRYPYAHSGATRVDAGWNYPQNGFKYIDPVPQAVIDADPDNFFTDPLTDEALTFYQETLEELGGELVEGGLFTSDSVVWVKSDPAITITGGEAVWDGSQAASANLSQLGVVESGNTYEMRVCISSVTAGGQSFWCGSVLVAPAAVRVAGDYKFRFTTTGTGELAIIGDSTFAGAIDCISVREVGPLINNNDQDFFGAKGTRPKQLTKYVNAQTGDCLVRAKDFHGI